MSPSAATHWDVIVIGGGPAGSTAATTLAMSGRRVLVLEKARFPRFHIGESLLPYNRRIFDDLGVWEKIAAAGFTKKRAAQFVMGNDSRGNRLDFSKGAFTQYPDAVQVDRATFDDLLLHHSREAGAEVREESTVLEHRVEKERVVIRYRAADSTVYQVTAPFLIDASGLTNFTANRESLRKYYPGHKKIAIFSHFGGVEMPQGEQEGDTIIVRRENSWCWLIPLSANKTSVGLVIDATTSPSCSSSPTTSGAWSARSMRCSPGGRTCHSPFGGGCACFSSSPGSTNTSRWRSGSRSVRPTGRPPAWGAGQKSQSRHWSARHARPRTGGTCPPRWMESRC